MYILVVSYGCPSERYPNNGIFQFDQAKALAEYGHRVVFAAVDMRSLRRWRKWGVSSREKDGIPVYEYSLPFGPLAQELRDRLAAKGFKLLLGKIIKERGLPDVVHAHFADTALCVIEACERNNIPYVVTEHSSGINRDDIAPEYAERLKRVYGKAAAVVAVSGPLAGRIYGHTGVKAVVVPNIVDTAIFKNAAR